MNDFAEIEFRAWTGKKMIYQGKNIAQDQELPCKQYLGSFIRRVVLQIMLDNDAATPLDHESYLPNGGNIDEYLMQYIGLTDKNGRKIFRGDILKFKGDDTGIVEFGKQNGAWCLFLPHVGTGIRVPMLNFIQNTMSLVASNDFEIIGNIYEYPELVEAPTHE